MIAQHGITWGLPLFQGKPAANTSSKIPLPHGKGLGEGVHIPDWLWNGTSVKAEVYHKMKDKFAEDSLLYLNAIISLGGRATDHEVKAFFNDDDKWTLAIVSARRNYFRDHPFYIITSYPGQKKPGPKGMPNIIWFVDYTKLFKLLM